MRRGKKGRVVQVNGAASDVYARGVVAFESRIGNTSLRRTHSAINGQVTPTHTRTWSDCETNWCSSGAFGQETAAVRHRNVDTRTEVNGGARLNRERGAARDGEG